VPTYQATIETAFAAAHALRLPDGTLEPVHGHNWPVRVTVASAGLDAADCVIDFHRLEEAVAAVIGPWRNRLLNEVEPFAGGVNPSAERVAEQIGRSVASTLPAGVALARVEVGGAPGCTAVYLPE